MKGLMLHCGADHLTRHQLAALPVPAPRGSRHVTRPFIDDVELVRERFTHEGVLVDDEAYGVKFDKETREPLQFFGVIAITIPGLTTDSSYSLMVGLRGSYDCTLTRALAVGSQVFVCDNLAFSGEIEVRTRQTLNIGNRIPQLMADAVAQIPQMAKSQQQRFERYRNHNLLRGHGDAILVDMVRKGAMTASQLGKALAEWDDPSHDEHKEQGHTLWRLHNAVTEAVKPANPQRAAVPATWERTRVMTDILDRRLAAAA
jgi:hypothetical protein